MAARPGSSLPATAAKGHQRAVTALDIARTHTEVAAVPSGAAL